MHLHLLSLLLLLSAVTSCGKSNSSAGIPIQKKRVIPFDGSNVEGLYMAKFHTLNGQVNGTIPGSATLQRQGDKFSAYVRLFGGTPNGWHQQNVYEGTRCPTPSDDTNGDGYIDVMEAKAVWGNILIPLDSNITSQLAGRSIYPVADESGSYFYERETSFKKFFRDLKSDDKDIDDNFAKLSLDQGLDVEGKVFAAFGVADTVTFPETVQTEDVRPVNQTFPIVCGTFKKVTSIPGEVEEGDSAPGPTGPVDNTPNPSPRPHDDGDVRPAPRPQPDDNNGDHWYDRIADWWRRTWNRDRGGRPQLWGNGAN